MIEGGGVGGVCLEDERKPCVNMKLVGEEASGGGDEASVGGGEASVGGDEASGGGDGQCSRGPNPLKGSII